MPNFGGKKEFSYEDEDRIFFNAIRWLGKRKDADEPSDTELLRRVILLELCLNQLKQELKEQYRKLYNEVNFSISILREEIQSLSQEKKK